MENIKRETMNTTGKIMETIRDLYGETAVPPLDMEYAKSITIEIDLSGDKRSLMELINFVRLEINDRPDDTPVTLYFVAGDSCPNNNWDALIDYINMLPNPIHAVYRGTVYPETLKILTNFNSLTIDKSLKFLYIEEKLSVVLNTLLGHPELFRGFMEKWIESYRFTAKVFIPATELSKIGFKFDILGE